MPHKNLRPCPNPHCRKTNQNNDIDVDIDKQEHVGGSRSRITCRKCTYSTGWWYGFHEMIEWWNKQMRK